MIWKERHKISKNLACQGYNMHCCCHSKTSNVGWKVSNGVMFFILCCGTLLSRLSVLLETTPNHPEGLRQVCSVTCQGETRQKRFGNYIIIYLTCIGNRIQWFSFSSKVIEILCLLVNPHLFRLVLSFSFYSIQRHLFDC